MSNPEAATIMVEIAEHTETHRWHIAKHGTGKTLCGQGCVGWASWTMSLSALAKTIEYGGLCGSCWRIAKSKEGEYARSRDGNSPEYLGER